MGLTLSNNFGALLAPGLRKIYGDSYADYPEEFSRVFNVETSKRQYEEDHSISSLGLVPVKPEGKGIEYDDAYDGLTKRYTHISYGLGFLVSSEAVEDDLYRKISTMPKALARSTRHTVEILAQNYLNNAFAASTNGSDGVPLCSASHPLLGGGTMSNMPSVAADLDITSFEQAIIDIEQNWVDDRGLKTYAKPIQLIVPAQLDFQAKMILKSSGLPDTANNNINPVENILPKGHTVLHWLTDTNAWFIKTDVPNGLNFFWRRKPDFKQDVDFDSENAKFKVIFRASLGHTDFRAIYASGGGS